MYAGDNVRCINIYTNTYAFYILIFGIYLYYTCTYIHFGIYLYICTCIYFINTYICMYKVMTNTQKLYIPKVMP